ncbi:MAG: uroporphyrinogen decarboxylase [Pseudomonadota bacterium]
MSVSPATPQTSRFLATLYGRQSEQRPIWFMRQAGRYLPEYRAVRAKAGSFLDLCYNPELACEVTIQPIDRYDLDAAILFADILLIPDALGQEVWFVAGEGPRLKPVITPDNLASFRDQYDPSVLDPVIETVRLTRRRLPAEKALIGFAGAPWTVATYMLEGGPSKDPSALRQTYYRQPDFMTALIDLLVDVTADYLIRQVDAGADALQLFDSWAQGLPPDLMTRLSLEPMVAIADKVRARHPQVPFIFFAKGAGIMLTPFAEHTASNAVGIDYSVPPEWARWHLSPHAVVQGGLDPLLVVSGGDAMEKAATRYLKAFSDVPHIFNLGHGFVPETPPENVATLVDIIRNWS